MGPCASIEFINGTNLVLIAGRHGGGQLWCLASNALVLDFKAPFRAAAFHAASPDQTKFFALSETEVRVAAWSYPRGDRLADFSEEWMQGYRYVCLTRDGRPRSWWQSDTGEAWPESRPGPVEKQPGFSDQALISPDGRRLVTYGTSITQPNASWLHLWDIESGRLLWHHPALDLPLTYGFRPAQVCAAIAFSPESRILAIGSRGGNLRIQEVEGARLVQELKTPPASCVRVAFLPKGTELLTWGDKTMRIWDLRTGSMIRSFMVPTAHCLAVTPDARFVLVGGDGEFRGL